MAKEQNIILAQNLKYQMEKKGVDRNQMCSELGFKYSTVSEWLSANKFPRMDKIEALANYFGIQKSDLIENKLGRKIPIEKNMDKLYVLESSKIRQVPIYENVSAGFGSSAQDYIIDYMPLYIESDIEAEDTICIKVVGDSMYPKIEEGDIIQVRKQSDVDNGSVAVIMIDGEDFVVKKFYHENDRIILKSFNPEYSPKIFKDVEMSRIQIVGLVRAIIKTL